MLHSTDRRAGFVGTLPQFDSAEEAIAWQLSPTVRDRVRRVCGGEVGTRGRWIVPSLQRLAQSEKVRVTHAGDWLDYTDYERVAVRPGQVLTTPDFGLRLVDDALAEAAVLDRSTSESVPRPPLQVGVYCYLDYSLFAFGPRGAARWGRSVLSALTEQVETIHQHLGDSAVFQLEFPVPTVLTASTPPVLRSSPRLSHHLYCRPVSAVLAALITRQIAAAPEGSRWVLHPCWGDLGHRSMTFPPSAGPIVELLNALIRRWPAGRRLDAVQLPLSAGDHPAPTDPAFYHHLRRLAVPAGTTIIAGIVDETRPSSEQFQARDLIEDALGRPVDVSAACGLGRRPPEQAWDAVRRTFELLTG